MRNPTVVNIPKAVSWRSFKCCSRPSSIEGGPLQHEKVSTGASPLRVVWKFATTGIEIQLPVATVSSGPGVARTSEFRPIVRAIHSQSTEQFLETGVNFRVCILQSPRVSGLSLVTYKAPLTATSLVLLNLFLYSYPRYPSPQRLLFQEKYRESRCRRQVS